MLQSSLYRPPKAGGSLPSSLDMGAIKQCSFASTALRRRGSRYWYCRVWDRDKKRYIVKGTGETSVIGAREVAKDYALSLLKTERAVERKFTFNHFAIKCLSKNTVMVAEGDMNIVYLKAIRWSLQNADWGLLKWFGRRSKDHHARIP